MWNRECDFQAFYRVARSILRNHGEAEDVMQDSYVRAYEHLDQFAGRAKLSTWLTRIAVHESLARQRRGNRYQELDLMSDREGDPMDRLATLAPDPEQQASSSETRRLLEEAVENLPGAYRTIFMVRDVEERSTSDTRACSRHQRRKCQGPPPSSAPVVTQKPLCASGNGKERSFQLSRHAV